MAVPVAFTPLSYTLSHWPTHLFGELGGALHTVGITNFEIDSSATGLAFTGTFAWLQEIALDIPAIEGARLVFLPPVSGASFTEFGFDFELAPDPSLTLSELSIVLELDSDVLRPVEEIAGEWVEVAGPARFTLGGPPDGQGKGSLSLRVEADGEVELLGTPTISPPALQLGETGIIVVITDLGLYLSNRQDPPINWPPKHDQPGFKGVSIGEATLHLGDALNGAATPETIGLTKGLIGSSGFSGRVEGAWDSPETTTLFGLQFSLKSLAFTFAQNRLVGSSITANMTLPFFDEELEVTLGYDAEGRVKIAVEGDIFELIKPNIIRVAVDQLSIDIVNGKATVHLSGTIEPLFQPPGGGIDWSEFEVRDLSIDHTGKIKIVGGWVELPKQSVIGFHGFSIEATQIGLGRTDAGGSWFGFSGRINLVRGAKEQPSVDGLKIIWGEGGDPRVTLEGIKLDTKLAGAFALKGSVSFKDEGGIKRFDGAAMLTLESPKMMMDSKIAIVRRNDGERGFYCYGAFEAPGGLPIAASGMFFYGVACLVGVNMAPDRGDPAALPWFAAKPAPDWYHLNQDGVTDSTKWKLVPGARAFGAGVTIGTADSGFTFNAKGLLAVTTPGPVIMLDMVGNALKPRTDLHGVDEPLFRAFAVYDRPAAELTFGLDLRYEYVGVIDLTASMEIFFKLDEPGNWHLYVGVNEPRSRRVQADVMSLFKAQSYFMIDPGQVSMGVWIGYEKTWEPKPLLINLEAWLDSRAILSLKPNHLHAGIWCYGTLDISAYGVGFGLSMSADISADVIDPFHLKGEFEACIRLPWPFKKKLCESVTLEWGPKPTIPPVSAIVHSAAIEHFKSHIIWQQPAGDLLRPDYATSEGFLGQPHEAPVTPAPIVPMDCRPTLSFRRPVHDLALIGLNGLPPSPAWEQIGDAAKGQGPAKVKYALTGVVLQEYDGSNWVDVAGKGEGASGLEPLYGCWSPRPAVTAGSVEQLKLTLWAKTPFEDMRFVGREYIDWFADNFKNYPCIEAPAMTCIDFESYAPNHFVDALITNGLPIGPQPQPHLDEPNVVIGTLGQGTMAEIVALDPPINGHTRALSGIGDWREFGTIFNLHKLVPRPKSIWIHFAPTAVIDLVVGWTTDNGQTGSKTFHHPPGPSIEINSSDSIESFWFFGVPSTILKICFSDDENAAQLQSYADNIQSGATVWEEKDEVLKPFTKYRLKVKTRDVLNTGSNTVHDQTSYAYFNTGGPPGLGGFSSHAVGVPVDQGDSLDASEELESLEAYVDRTIPGIPSAQDIGLALPRPVFRTYDIGVEFNENYVSQLYKMAGRDLTVDILDHELQPARGLDGRILTYANPWGVVPDVTLNEAASAWTQMVDTQCLTIPLGSMARNQTLSTAERAMLLEPMTRYVARLTPHIVSEGFGAPNFTDGDTVSGQPPKLADWLLERLGDATADWSTSVTNNGAHMSGGGTPDQNDQIDAESGATPGSALLYAGTQGATLTDLRLAVYVANDTSGWLGIVFAYASANDHMLILLNATSGMVRLCRKTQAGYVRLAEATPFLDTSGDFELEIEVLSGAVSVFVDGDLALDGIVGASPLSAGQCGLWCEAGTNAQFKDFRVQSFGAGAIAPYRFEFVSSKFADFRHLAHSRRLPVWPIRADSKPEDVAIGPLASVTATDAPASEAEFSQFDALAGHFLRERMARPVTELEINRVDFGGEGEGYILLSPEPMQWSRSTIELLARDGAVPETQALGPVKIVDAVLGTTDIDAEYIDLLVLEDVVLDGYVLQRRDVTATNAVQTDPALAFDSDQVEWVGLHAFDPGKLVSGQRLRLHTGALSAVINLLRLDLALSTGTSGPHYPATGVDLRLLDANGRIACSVRILPRSDFGVVNTQFIRSRDATGVLIRPAGGGTFDQGAYALQLTYRLDISADDPEAVRLSRSGNSDPETAFTPLY